MRHIIKTALTVGALAAGLAGVFAPTASASDEGYLDMARDRGVDIYDEDAAIEWGHRVCEDINDGWTPDQIAQALIANGKPVGDSFVMVAAATSQLCFGRG